MVFTACNEARDEVQATIESALAAYHHERLQIIFVDDGSEEPVELDLPEQAPVQIIRHEEPCGVGRSRNHGYRLAVEWLEGQGGQADGSGVVGFFDAHMRFPNWDELLEHADERGLKQLDYMRLRTGGRKRTSLEILARKAARGRAVITNASRDVREERGFWASGADLFWNRRDGLQAKWRLGSFWQDAEAWERVPCMMGAAYFMSVEVAEELAVDQSENGGRSTGEPQHAMALTPDPPPGGNLSGSGSRPTGYGTRQDKLQQAGGLTPDPPSGGNLSGSVSKPTGYGTRQDELHQAGGLTPDAPPGGNLWEDLAGRWGFSEQSLSVKAFLLDVPVIASRNVFTRHLYRSENPIPDAAREVWKNVAHAGSRLFRPEVFRRRFLPYCRERLTEAELERALSEGCGANVDRPWSVQDERRVFTHLCGKNAPVPARHPDHGWLDRVEQSAKELPDGARVLQWRPGESTLLVARLRPDVRITCISLPGPRANNWRPVIDALAGVEMIEAEPPQSYVETPLRRSSDLFDLILVGGASQRACVEVGQKLLRRGGRIITNERADRLQIEGEERRKEAEQLSNHRDTECTEHSTQRGLRGETTEKTSGEPEAKSRVGARVMNSPGQPGLPSVTVILLNWKRPENLPAVLDGLQMQAVRPRIWLWDNSPGGAPEAVARRCDLVVRSNRNLGCFARWWLASRAATPYVCSIDDDFRLTDGRLLDDAVEACREKCPDGIVGIFGWKGIDGCGTGGSPTRAGPVIDYKQGRHVNGATEDTNVDLVKGRFMVFRRDLLDRVPLRPPARVLESMGEHAEELLLRCDDIYLNLMIARNRTPRRRGLIPAALGEEGERWNEAGPQDERALATDEGHYDVRGRAIEAILEYFHGRGSDDD